MSVPYPGRLGLRVELDKFPYKEPFRITGHTVVDSNVVTVTLGRRFRADRQRGAPQYS